MKKSIYIPQKHKGIFPPKDWNNAYPNSEFLVVSQDNYLEFICNSNNSKLPEKL